MLTPIEYVLMFPMRPPRADEYFLERALGSMPDAPEEARSKLVNSLAHKVEEQEGSVGVYIKNKAELDHMLSYVTHEMERLVHVLGVFDKFVSYCSLFCSDCG